MKHAPDGTTSGVAIGGAGGRGSCPPSRILLRSVGNL